MYALLRSDKGRTNVIASFLYAIDNEIATTLDATQRASLCDHVIPCTLSLATGYNITGGEVQVKCMSRIDAEILPQMEDHVFLIKDSVNSPKIIFVSVIHKGLISENSAEWLVHKLLCQIFIHESQRDSESAIRVSAHEEDVAPRWVDMLLRLIANIQMYGEYTSDAAYRLRMWHALCLIIQLEQQLPSMGIMIKNLIDSISKVSTYRIYLFLMGTIPDMPPLNVRNEVIKAHTGILNMIGATQNFPFLSCMHKFIPAEALLVPEDEDM